MPGVKPDAEELASWRVSTFWVPSRISTVPKRTRPAASETVISGAGGGGSGLGSGVES